MNVLHVGWGFRPWRGGGLIQYAEDLMRIQAERGYRVGYFFSGRRYPFMTRPSLRTWRRDGISMFEIVNGAIEIIPDRGVLGPRLDLEDPFAETSLRSVLVALEPDVVHIQELAGLPSSIIDVVKERGTPILMTLQDYLPLCPVVKLVDVRNATCLSADVGQTCVRCCSAAPEHAGLLSGFTVRYEIKRRVPSGVVRAIRTATGCLKGSGQRAPQSSGEPGTLRSPGELPGGTHPWSASLYQERRETGVRRLNRVDLLIAMSHRVKRIYEELGVHEERMRVLHLTNAHFAQLGPKRHIRVEPPVTFAVSNALANPAKGARVVLDALRFLKEAGTAARFRLLVFGIVGAEFARELTSHENVTLCGHYDVSSLDAILEDVDVGIVPSTWEEAYGYVGIEFLAKGIPVIGNRIGGIVDYTVPGETGWLNDTNDGVGLGRIMADLIRDPTPVSELSRGILGRRDSIVKPMPVHFEEIETLYRELAQAGV